MPYKGFGLSTSHEGLETRGSWDLNYPRPGNTAKLRNPGRQKPREILDISGLWILADHFQMNVQDAARSMTNRIKSAGGQIDDFAGGEGTAVGDGHHH